MSTVKKFNSYIGESKQEWFALGNSGYSILPYNNGKLKVRIDSIHVSFDMFDKDLGGGTRILKTIPFSDFNTQFIEKLEQKIYNHLNNKLDGDW